MRKFIVFGFIIFCFSCNVKDEKTIESKLYFDIEGYFNKEATRLNKKHVAVEKMVSVNGKSEEKKVKIHNWKKEFNSFISADINKASWRGSFKSQEHQDLRIYTSNNEKIPVKKLEIAFKRDQVLSIKIFLETKNSLYVSRDSLTYIPDSIYIIKKTQNIKLMDPKNYRIVGKFK